MTKKKRGKVRVKKAISMYSDQKDQDDPDIDDDFDADIARMKRERLARENAQRIDDILEDFETRKIFRRDQLDYVDPYTDVCLFDRIHSYSSRQVEEILDIFMMRTVSQRTIPYDITKVLDDYDERHKIVRPKEEKEEKKEKKKKKKKKKSSSKNNDEISLFTDNNSYGGLDSPGSAAPFAEFGPEDVVEDFNF